MKTNVAAALCVEIAYTPREPKAKGACTFNGLFFELNTA